MLGSSAPWRLHLHFSYYCQNDNRKQRDEFSSMYVSMLTILRCVTDGSTAHDGTPLQQPLYEMYGPMFAFVYYVVYLGVTIGLFNLIMSIFIQTVLESGTTRWQQQLGEDKSRLQHRIGGYFMRRFVESRFVDVSGVEDDAAINKLFN